MGYENIGNKGNLKKLSKTNVFEPSDYDNVIIALPLKYTYKVDIKKGRAIKLPKARKSEIEDSKIKIVHTMADGIVRDSIEGYEIPYNGITAIAYELLAKWTIEKQKKQNK